MRLDCVRMEEEVPIIAVEGGEERTTSGVSEPIGDEHSHNCDGKN